MSKPSPAAPKGDAGSRYFWRDGAVAEAPAGVELRAGPVEDAHAVAQTVRRLAEHALGFDEWLEPLDPAALAAAAARTCLAQAAQAKDAAVVGALLARRLEGEVRGFGKKLGSLRKDKVAVLGHLATAAGQRGLGVTPALLATMEAALRADGTQLALFASPDCLPTPPVATATVKWYRRACEPAAVFRTDFAENVFPEFFEYDTILRADAICKNAIPAALESKHAEALQGWSDVDLQQEEQAQWLLDFLQTHTTEAVAEMAYVPTSVAALRADLGHPANHIYVRVVDDVVHDMVVLRLRDVRCHEGGSATPAAEAPPIAQVVYALFAKLTGTDRVEHVLLLAHHLLRVQVVYMASLFGVTESDLAKSNFEEIMKNREFLYLVGSNSRTAAVVPATPASKLYPPVYFC
ncbi:hypothetical protein STCU_07308 [Strigomonas culicis]|uniref:Uncharacterized protein n=1 Tax=Strigomonas culicis TaxID=28005 RepID=S9U0B6_9TRYP|nr:hypothetical protein STCU_07308 [Strigomonas culicis]|eukprot:EPY24182.1 hypothetical protein STCU_07308 [Strigomonas culicis]